MKAFVTGATGFVGGRVAAKLRERGDEVVCLVRSPQKAGELEALGCEIVTGDLRDQAAIELAMSDADAAFHIAADYRVGIKSSSVPNMEAANVGGTTRVIDAAVAAGVKKIVYVSTIAAFGNTKGSVVDETYEREEGPFTSEYERTKVEAHRIAFDRIAQGAPVVVVQPGVIYGRGDHSAVGQQIKQAAAGKLPGVAFGDLGVDMVHVDDVADGILLAHDKGRAGQAYVLGGEITTLKDVLGRAARIKGRKPPRMKIPTVFLKAIAPAGPLVGKAMGVGPNLRELISASDGVTYWARHDKASDELGYDPRPLDVGLRQVVEGKDESSLSTSASPAS